MKIEIVDSLGLTPEKQPKKIELIACLQHHPGRSKEYFFANSSFNLPFGTTKVERVGTHGEGLDLIKVWRKEGNEDDTVWYLGHWNDGVI